MRLLVRFLGFLFAAGTVVFLVGVAAVAGAIWHFSKDLPDYSQLQDYEPPVMTRVHAADGALLGEYSKERRLYLRSRRFQNSSSTPSSRLRTRISTSMAVIDFSVWRAPPFSMPRTSAPTAVRRALPPSPQQVAKNFLLTNEVSFTRKIKEALLAMRIERAYSKDKISNCI